MSTQARLPYADDTDDWPARPESPALTELRLLRDAYGRKAAAALARRFPHTAGAGWLRWAEEVARMPIAQIEGLMVLADMIADMGDWSAVTRFGALAERVWEAECQELQALCYGQGRH